MGVTMNSASAILNSRLRRSAPGFFLAILALTLATGCGGRHHYHLARYDFHGSTLALDAPFAPMPEIVTDVEGEALEGVSRGTVGGIFRAATSIAKEVTAHKARKRFDRAAESVDVSMLVAEGVLPRAARYLGARPTDNLETADFVMILRIFNHGIYAGPSYEGGMEYFLEAKIEMVDNHNGRVVWKRDVGVQEPITRGGLVVFDNVRSARELDQMSEAEMIDALERLSSYSADAITRTLARDLDRAR